MPIGMIYKKLIPRDMDDKMGGKKPLMMKIEKDKQNNKMVVPIKNKLDEI